MAGGFTGRQVEHDRGWSIYAWRPTDDPTAGPEYFTAGPAGTFQRKRFDTIEKARAFIGKQQPIERVKVEFEVSVPPGIAYTQDQLESWLRFSFGKTGSLSGSNPFMDKEPQIVSGTFWVG